IVGLLKKDQTPALYLDRFNNIKNDFVCIVAGTSLPNYHNKVINKHETTLKYRVENLKDYFNETGFNTEPVLMMYPNCEVLQDWIQTKMTETPLYNFSTTNREQHFVWKIDQNSEITFLQETFKKFPNLYIADGH